MTKLRLTFKMYRQASGNCDEHETDKQQMTNMCVRMFWTAIHIWKSFTKKWISFIGKDLQRLGRETDVYGFGLRPRSLVDDDVTYTVVKCNRSKSGIEVIRVVGFIKKYWLAESGEVLTSKLKNSWDQRGRW